MFRYYLNIRKDTKRHLDSAIRSLKQCEDNQILVFDSYYMSNVILHLRDTARGESKVDVDMRPETVNGVDGFALYSCGMKLAFGSQQRIVELKICLERYSTEFTKEYGKIRTSLRKLEPLLSNFQKNIHALVLKAKYGSLKGKCEFERVVDNV